MDETLSKTQRGEVQEASGAGRRRGGDKARRILDAAIEVFAERGFYNATIAEVARRAGVADGTIYLYYKGKDDLFIRLFEEIMARINARLEEATAACDRAADKVRALVLAQAELVEAEPAFAEVICVELRQSSKFMKEYDNPGFRAYLNLIAEVIAGGQASGEFSAPGDPQILARALFGAVDEIHLAWLLARRHRFDLKQAAAEVADLFVRGLGG
ncbi:MAG: TetR/AcrR family transcriptional regulator [Deltaproteobacteria bacterium]|nr:MAG: TetR/AcrR family transcriptional regulator [Deltaproteobacteria bacterium]